MDISNLGVFANGGLTANYEYLFDGIGVGGQRFLGDRAAYGWIGFDLKVPTKIKKITVVNLDQGETHVIQRFQKVQVRIGNTILPLVDSGGIYLTVNQVCGYYEGPPSSGETIEIEMDQCSEPVGQYISIQNNCGTNTCHINILEIWFNDEPNLTTA